jgi:hypothetical protein
MRESEADMAVLQTLLDRSFAEAGAHLRSIFDEAHRPSAAELAQTLDGIVEIHLATVAHDGAPLVAPVDAIFFRGKVWFGLPPESVRSRLVRRDPRVSASYTNESFAFIVHGVANEIVEVVEEFDQLVRELYVAQFGPGWIQWHEHRQRELGPGYNGWIEPRVMFVKR